MGEKENMDVFLRGLLGELHVEDEKPSASDAMAQLLYDHYTAFMTVGFPEERAFVLTGTLLTKIMDCINARGKDD